jgi:hypothetical protein
MGSLLSVSPSLLLSLSLSLSLLSASLCLIDFSVQIQTTGISEHSRGGPRKVPKEETRRVREKRKKETSERE